MTWNYTPLPKSHLPFQVHIDQIAGACLSIGLPSGKTGCISGWGERIRLGYLGWTKNAVFQTGYLILCGASPVVECSLPLCALVVLNFLVVLKLFSIRTHFIEWKSARSDVIKRKVMSELDIRSDIFNSGFKSKLQLAKFPLYSALVFLFCIAWK